MPLLTTRWSLYPTTHRPLTSLSGYADLEGKTLYMTNTIRHHFITYMYMYMYTPQLLDTALAITYVPLCALTPEYYIALLCMPNIAVMGVMCMCLWTWYVCVCVCVCVCGTQDALPYMYVCVWCAMLFVYCI